MDNRITPELAGVMIRSLIDILATGVQQQAEGSLLETKVQQAHAQEGGNGVV
ncbi:hypothetical protein ACXHWJ_10025 [Alcaligenes nematophilus]